MIVLASADAAVLRRWGEALPHNRAAVRQAATLADLEGLMSGRRPQLVVLDLRLPELRRIVGLPALLRYSPDTRVLTMAETPSDEEALAALRAGARGYANVHMDPRLLARAMHALSQGEVWVARRLVHRLLETFVGMRPAIAGTSPPGALTALSSREREIALLIGEGSSNKDIARRLDISERTVKAHLSSVFDKLGVRDRVQLALIVNGYVERETWAQKAG
jgi:two-component system, NarL family, nitrate/nitrite response regulator NarL